MTRRVIILGSTGSIGTQAIGVIEHVNALHARGEADVSFKVVGLAARRNGEALRAQAERLGVGHVAILEPDSHPGATFTGEDAGTRLVASVEADVVLAAMVGVAGLPAAMEAVKLGRDLALANKETLVAAGELVVPLARATGSRLLPVDSEHAGLWQCLMGRCAGAPAPPNLDAGGVERLVLTASGGPFREWPRERIVAATPGDALKHPTWRMGAKVTVDSASLMNKGLEIIEAHWLFGVEARRIAAVVHPQSVVHAMVEFTDGSVLAQLAPPDMRGPIQHALSFPYRAPGVAPRLDLRSLGRLEFESPDLDRFPALLLAYQALALGGTALATLNAANEAAVEAFLAPGSRVRFGQIAGATRDALDEFGSGPVSSIEDVMRADHAARGFVRRRLGVGP